MEGTPQKVVFLQECPGSPTDWGREGSLYEWITMKKPSQGCEVARMAGSRLAVPVDGFKKIWAAVFGAHV